MGANGMANAAGVRVRAAGKDGADVTGTGGVRATAPAKAAPAAGEVRPRLTEDLLERLLSSRSIDAYLDETAPADRALVEYLNELLHVHGLKRAEVIRASGINATVVYDIFAGKSKPGRDHAIMLAFGLGCSLRETQRLLRQAGVSELYAKIRRDAIIAWCIDQGATRAEADDELFRFGEKTLLATGRLG